MASNRRRAWADTPFDIDVASNGALLNDLRGSLNLVETLTCVRLVIDLTVEVLTISEDEGQQMTHLGVGVCSSEAFDMGATPVPNDSTAYPTLGWMYVGSKAVNQSLPTGGGITAMHRLVARYSVDIRASRKVDRGVLYSILQNRTSQGTAQPLRVSGRIRALFLT